MSEIINRDNYEQYLIDYLDGNLSSLLTKEIELFLLKNPDIAYEFENINSAFLPPEKIEFNAKEELKIRVENLIPTRFSSFDEFLAAFYEGDTSMSENKILNLIIKDDEARKRDYDLIFKTKLEADLSIIFPGKEHLKKSAVLYMISSNKKWIYSLAAAAILIVFFLLVKTDNTDSLKNEVAVKPKTKVEQNKITNPIELPQNESIAESLSPQNPVEKRKFEYNTNVVNLNDLNKIAFNNQDTNSILPQNINKVEVHDFAFDGNNKIDNYQNNKALISVDTSLNNNKPSVIGQSYALNQYIYIQMRESLFNENREESSTRKFSGWDIADAGIRRLGKTFDKDWNLQKKYNEDGALNSVAFDSKLLSFSVPLK